MGAPSARLVAFTRELVLDAARDLIAEHGYSPTVQDIATALGIAKATAYHHLLTLRDEGRVTWLDGHTGARTLRVVATTGAPR